MTSEPRTSSNAEHPESDARRVGRLAWWLRPNVAIPSFLMLLLLASPVLIRGYKLSQVPEAPDPFDIQAVLDFRVPDERNAYVEYRQAISQLVELPTSEATNLVEALDMENWDNVPPSIRQWVADNHGVIQLCIQGSAKPDAQDSPPGQPPDPATVLPRAQGQRTLIRLIPLEVLRLRAEGHPRQAWELLLAGLRMGYHVGRRGDLLDRTFSSAAHAVMSNATTKWAQDPIVSQEMLEQAQRELAVVLRQRPPLSYSIQMSYLNQRLWLQQLAANAWLPDSHAAPSSPQRFGRMALYSLGEPELCDRVWRHQIRNYLPEIDKPRRQRARRSGRHRHFELDPSASPTSPTPQKLDDWSDQSILCQQCGFGMKLFFAAEDREELRGHLLKTVFALEIYRRQHGVYPETLDLLVPDLLLEIPDDIFEPSPAPLKYHREGDRAKIWSVYDNGTDQGGEIEKFKDYGYALGRQQP